MTHTATPKTHLRLVHSVGPRIAKPKVNHVRKDRIALATIFSDPLSRHQWINQRTLEILHDSKKGMEEIVNHQSTETESRLVLIRAVRDSFLISINHNPSEEVSKLLDTIALLAIHSYRLLGTTIKTIPLPIDYTEAYTSSDFYTLDPQGQKMNMKAKTDLAKVIHRKDFAIDTSDFEREIAESALAALELRIRRFKSKITREQLSRFTLSIFTALTQEKLLTRTKK